MDQQGADAAGPEVNSDIYIGGNVGARCPVGHPHGFHRGAARERRADKAAGRGDPALPEPASSPPGPLAATCGTRRWPGHMPSRPNSATRAGTSRGPAKVRPKDDMHRPLLGSLAAELARLLPPRGDLPSSDASPAGSPPRARRSGSPGWTAPATPPTANAPPGTCPGRDPRCCAGWWMRPARPIPAPPPPATTTTRRSRTPPTARPPPCRRPARSSGRPATSWPSSATTRPPPPEPHPPPNAVTITVTPAPRPGKPQPHSPAGAQPRPAPAPAVTPRPSARAGPRGRPEKTERPHPPQAGGTAG